MIYRIWTDTKYWRCHGWSNITWRCCTSTTNKGHGRTGWIWSLFWRTSTTVHINIYHVIYFMPMRADISLSYRWVLLFLSIHQWSVVHSKTCVRDSPLFSYRISETLNTCLVPFNYSRHDLTNHNLRR
jgi:hypothetical protein